MKKYLLFFLLMILIVNLNVVFCEDISNVEKNNEDQIYKLMYENSKENNQKILQTVYWALSSILVVILAILGSNIYYNYKFNKKEKQIMSEEINNQLKDLENKTIMILDNNFRGYSNQTRTELKNEIDKQFKGYTEQFKIKEDYLKERIKLNSEKSDGLMNHFDKYSDLMKDILGKIDQVSTEKDNRMDKIQDELLISIYEIKLKSSDKNSFDDKLKYYIAIFEIQIKQHKTSQSTLNKIIELMGEYESIPIYMYYDLNKIIHIIPEEYKAQKEIIIELIKNSKKN